MHCRVRSLNGVKEMKGATQRGPQGLNLHMKVVMLKKNTHVNHSCLRA